MFSLASSIAEAEKMSSPPARTKEQAIRPKRLEIDVWKRRVSDALSIWRQATTDERNQLQAALNISDTRNAVKKSDGPPESEATPVAGKKPSA